MAQPLAGRRQLIASVSHELRTPIATVRGYLDSALQHDGVVPTQLRSDLETMEREIGRLQHLIDDLFTLSRAELGRLVVRSEPTQVGAVAQRVVDAQAPLAWRQRRVEVLAQVVENVPAARADAERLEQMIGNLVNNAIQHTPWRACRGGRCSRARLGAHRRPRPGDGIAQEDLPRVFERFYRGTDSNGRGGAGLGLALVKELAETMGGTVEATSTPGEGSCLSVRLPHA